jgi:hypothetical protein
MSGAPAKDLRAAAAELSDRRSESVRVVVRVRPMSSKEIADGQRVILRIDGGKGQVQIQVCELTSPQAERTPWLALQWALRWSSLRRVCVAHHVWRGAFGAGRRTPRRTSVRRTRRSRSTTRTAWRRRSARCTTRRRRPSWSPYWRGTTARSSRACGGRARHGSCGQLNMNTTCGAPPCSYGQTGAGKSFTMEGRPDPPEMRGIIPNSFKARACAARARRRTSRTDLWTSACLLYCACSKRGGARVRSTSSTRSRPPRTQRRTSSCA